MRVASAVALLLMGCSNEQELTDAQLAALDAQRAEVEVAQAIATLEPTKITRYLVLYPNGPSAGPARAALARIAPVSIQRYRAGGSILAVSPDVLLAIVEVLEAVSTTDRRVPMYWERRVSPPAGSSPADEHLRESLTLANDRMNLWASGHENDSLKYVTRSLFDVTSIPGRMPPGDQAAIEMIQTIESSGVPYGADGLPGVQVRIELTVRVPPRDGHPGRTVQKVAIVGIPSSFQIQWHEQPGNPIEAARNRASAFYTEVFRVLGIESRARAAIMLATVARPEEYGDTFPVPRALRAWDAVVVGAEGLPGIATGDRCRVQLGHGEPAQPCRTVVSCEGVVVYGAGATGFGQCPTTPGVLVDDQTTSPGDQDPAITARSDTLSLTIRDEAGSALGPFTLQATMTPAATPAP